MAGIDKTNLRSMAIDIAKQLDRKDTKGEDGKIEASIWNEFVADKGGKQIKNSITLENAIKSITTYIARNAAKTDEAFGDIADKWFNKTSPIEKVVTPPVRQVPASELPPQQFKMPENIPEVKPLPYTEEDLEEMFVKPGQDVLEHRESGKILGETIALLINNGSSYEEEVNPKDAAYTFSELMEEIPDLAEKFDGQTLEIVQNIYNGLKKRAEELGINLIEVVAYDEVDISKEPPSVQIGILREISNAIKAHDESAINEMNMYQSIKTPNPELAGKTIEDKVCGKTYEYDENGQISTKHNNSLEFDVVAHAVGILLKLGSNPKISIDFDENGYLINGYDEDYTDSDGVSWSVTRDDAGRISDIHKEYENNEIHSESWSPYANDTYSYNEYLVNYDGGHWQTAYYRGDDLEYIRTVDYGKTTLRDKDGILMGTCEETDYNSAYSTRIYRNADGELIATKEVAEFSLEGENKYTYKDADGNIISKEQFNELVDERLR